MELFDWNFTKCRAKYSNSRANYTFYIVDYDFPDDFEKYSHILKMRNEGIVKTKYFHTRKEAIDFLNRGKYEKT